MYPEKLKVIAQQVQLQQQQEQVRLLHQEKLEREQQHLRTQVSSGGLGAVLTRSVSAPGSSGAGPGSQVTGSQVACVCYHIESL